MYKYYYTLNEVIQDNTEVTHSGTTSGFYHLCDLAYTTIPTWASMTSTEYPYLDEMLERVRSMFQRDGLYFYISVNELEGQDLTDEATPRLMDFINTFYVTKDKYISLIKAQEDLKDSILSDVTNSTETWFNDTPQVKGTYTDLDYASNYTRTKNNISLGPVSLKLEEVDKAMEDIYDRWLNDFRKFIIVY